MARFCHCPEYPEIEQKPDVIKTDTLPERKKETIKPKPYKSLPVPEIIYASDTVKVDSFVCDEYNFYSDTLKDSTGIITVDNKVRGELISQTITFKPIQTTITKVTVVKFPVPQRGLFVGLEVGTSVPLKWYRIAPEVEYLTRKGLMFSYSYDIANRVHSAGFKKRLF